MTRAILAASSAAVGGVLALSFTSSPAAAQDGPCGGRYTVRPGDTLAVIAQQCRVPLAEILRANPQIRNPSLIEVGWRLTLPGAGGPPPWRGEGRERLEATVTPRAGPSGLSVDLRGEGFEPYQAVEVAVGRAESEWDVVSRTQADGRGRVSETVQVPRWADAGDDLVFVLIAGPGREARTQRFDVVDRRDPDAPPNAGDDRRVDVRGEVSQGAECPILTTDDGRVYSLASSGAADVRTGVRAHVEGRVVDMSYCMQGTPIEVGLFRVTGEDGRRVPLRREQVLGRWTPRGGDCRRPALHIQANRAGGQMIETSLDGAPRTGYVRLGENPAFVFDQPRREFGLEPRRANGLAVSPPDRGPVRLGGQWISGDGVVFIRCAEEFVGGGRR
ncbi:LysM peptidoglycan-binding domain-containing protein [Phenylobacterium sp.]|uniref:LysM peptidoglycan-binding domain-containing protein n=2 Tax=Phenylobacterium sp. TaxID=1871053 RepID=UPI001986EB0C|nr:LysM peptidoglycan-binding domain-containing protein [Phenylobacterium sp.]MBC7167728.1 LysM peptidoglycan-binding domain-containing protein [Phenylobacterium sp.]